MPSNTRPSISMETPSWVPWPRNRTLDWAKLIPAELSNSCTSALSAVDLQHFAAAHLRRWAARSRPARRKSRSPRPAPTSAGPTTSCIVRYSLASCLVHLRAANLRDLLPDLGFDLVVLLSVTALSAHPWRGRSRSRAGMSNIGCIGRAVLQRLLGHIVVQPRSAAAAGTACRSDE